MSSFLFVEDDENLKSINIDDLYEKKQRRDLRQVAIFNKILNRIQKRIVLTARNKSNEQHIWFVVPEYIFGEPVYDQGDCIAYIVTKLEDSRFQIRYVHPNTLYVSWSHFVPSYVRNEFKKKTGMLVDEYGNVVSKGEKGEEEDEDPNRGLHRGAADKTSEAPARVFTPIGKYKPTGALVYTPELFEKLEKKVTFANSN